MAATAVDAQYRFEHWDTHNGLPQISVVGVTQTPDGYVWVATRDGLVRFDGIRFTAFNKTRSPGMDTNRLSTLFCDREGRLWIGTEDGRLIARNGGTFRAFGTVDPQRAHNAVRHVRETRDGHLWVATLRWIGQLDAQGGGSFNRIDALPGRKPDPEAIPEFAYYAAGAVHRFADGRFVTATLAPGLETQDVSVLGEDQHGRLWIATGSGALYQLAGTEFRPVRGILPFSPKRVTALLLDRAGHLWVGAMDALAVIAPDGSARTFTRDDGFVAREIRTLFEDSEGTIWIGDAAAGLTSVRKQVFTNLGERHGLSPSNVYTVLEDAGGAMWFSTWPRGLTRYRNGQFARFAAAEGISVAPVTALYQDVNGDFLVGGYSGVEVLHPGAARFELLPYVADAFVAAIYRDERRTLWLGTSRGWSLWARTRADSQSPRASLTIPFAPSPATGTGVCGSARRAALRTSPADRSARSPSATGWATTMSVPFTSTQTRRSGSGATMADSRDTEPAGSRATRPRTDCSIRECS